MLKIFTVQGKTDWLILLVSILLSLGTGFVGRFLVHNPKEIYNTLILPEFSPPAYVFLPVWTILYLLIGIAIYRITIHDGVLLSDEDDAELTSENLLTEQEKIGEQPLDPISKKKAYLLFAAQLLANFLWSIIFFRAKAQVWALVDIIILLVLIVLTMREFRKFDRIAVNLFWPYLIWVLFACSLNFGIVMLNTLY